ncbi:MULTISPECIES: tripartite tricarboxylate transporter permease [Tritonibacter]|uniref:Putative tricarboxylic transport membrane protein n=1 Tax=Tritonibacter scottomollicae TaxID=483013 RepID=A0A2T1AHY2_TRISK|nr:tripartite tricarboxylate transporter permease [Tritonibacter scottomollicae]PRZ48201.1 putative tricarboxylic transport membrane protein [Tritonibacter scottomollicae]WOI33473.1 tripartite tricarboxylate transporter permease [Tritonibacter scottomollicae]
MDILNSLIGGIAVAVTPLNLALAVFGCFAGTLIGALPGLGPVNGVAILIPVAFAMKLEPSSALIMLSCIYYGCMYGGRISSIMLNIPGDEPAIMTTLDGYPMARRGQAAKALGISAVASFVGATVATLGLTFFAPLLAKAAIHFGPADYFALYVMAFATIGGVTGVNPFKTLLAAMIGLLLASVGLDPGTGTARFTFGSFHLYDGFDPIVAIVGLFAVSEIIMYFESHALSGAGPVKLGRTLPRLREVFEGFGASIRGALIGFVCGVLPGAGASLGAFVSYSTEKQLNDKNGTFGTGDPRGIAAPEAGNNAASGGALIPMLTLGVPGSGTTAVMLALLVSLNIQPGPLLFERQPDLVWGLIAALYLANVVLLLLNIPMVGIFTRLLSLPQWFLMPVVVMVSFIGIYSISHSTFDLFVMIGFGLLGYALRKFDISLVPVVLGLLLGADMENNLRRALSISGGDFNILLQSPIALAIYAFTALMLAFSFGIAMRRRGPRSAK